MALAFSVGSRSSEVIDGALLRRIRTLSPLEQYLSIKLVVLDSSHIFKPDKSIPCFLSHWRYFAGKSPPTFDITETHASIFLAASDTYVGGPPSILLGLVEFGRRMKSIEKCPKTTKSNVFDSILFIIFSASSSIWKMTINMQTILRIRYMRLYLIYARLNGKGYLKTQDIRMDSCIYIYEQIKGMLLEHASET